MTDNHLQRAPDEKIDYVLYARKSSESDEAQALSIDSQITEMKSLAKREDLNVIEVKQESHSAKAANQRPVFNQMIEEIKSGEYGGVLTWAPDRLSRNAGDLGSLVDLMDQDTLKVIQTHGQRFADDPSEKFMLMIMGSQAKLENDNRSKNVKRGLRARCEQGLMPTRAPTGYLKHPDRDKKCHVVIDPKRGPIVRQMFEKVADYGYSGRDILKWLKEEVEYENRNGNDMALSTIYQILRNTFYYGEFEFPKESGNWYHGVHEPIISKDLFERVQARLDKRGKKHSDYGGKNFAFTKIMTCGGCGSGITAEEKAKQLKNKTTKYYTYYRCSRGSEVECNQKPINEPDLMVQVCNILDAIAVDKIGIREKLEREVRRFNVFQNSVLDNNEQIQEEKGEMDVRRYAKYIFKEGTRAEKREILSCLEGEVVLENKQIQLK